MFTALAAVPVFAIGGLAVDYLRTDRAITELQQIADAAALAAASAQNITGDQSAKVTKRKQIAKNYLASSLPAVQDIVPLGEPTIDVSANTVDVTIAAKVEGSFINALKANEDGSELGGQDGGMQDGSGGGKSFDFTVHSKAAWSKDSYLCLLALNPTASESVYFQGNSEFMAQVCTVQANSNATVAMRTWGNAYAEAEDFCAVGGWAGSGFEPAPDNGCTAKADPYANLPAPTVGACDYNNRQVKNTTATLNPGVYCGGLDVTTHGVANLNPGLYIIKNGKFSVGAQGTVNAGGGVTFYLTGNSSLVDIASGAVVTIKAPTSETAATTTAPSGTSYSTVPYKSIAFFHDRTTGVGNENVIRSKGGVNITGAFYAPKQKLTVWANGDMNGSSPYFPMVVDKLEMNGTATLHVKLDYKAAGFDEPQELKTKGKIQLTQ